MLLKNKEPQTIEITNISLQFLENVYIDKLEDMVNKYNNTYHRTIKMEFIDVKSSKHIDFEAESNDKGPKFKTM